MLTPKPVVYMANVPAEAAPSSDSDHDEDEPKEVSESAEDISRVALAHADKVIGLNRDYRVPAVVGCLRNRDGQSTLGAAVRSVFESVFKMNRYAIYFVQWRRFRLNWKY